MANQLPCTTDFYVAESVPWRKRHIVVRWIYQCTACETAALARHQLPYGYGDHYLCYACQLDRPFEDRARIDWIFNCAAGG